MTTRHTDEILALVDALPAGADQRLAVELAGGPLGELGHALLWPRPGRRRDGTIWRGVLAKLSVDRALHHLAKTADSDVIAEAMFESGDPLWRLVGEAIVEMREAPPCSIDPGCGISCPAGTDDCVCVDPDDPRLVDLDEKLGFR